MSCDPLPAAAPTTAGARPTAATSAPTRSRRAAGTLLLAFATGSAVQGLPLVFALVAVGDRGGSAWVGLAAAARLVPYLVCSPFAGAVAARHDAAVVLLVANVSRTVLVVALVAAAGIAAPLPVLVTLLLLVTAAGTPSYPAVLGAVRGRCSDSAWPRASVVVSGVESASFWLGPAVGGMLLVVGEAAVVASTIAVGGIAVAAASCVPRGRAPGHGGPPVRIGHGAATLLRRRSLPSTIGAVGVNVLAGLTATLLLEWARGAAADGSSLFGVLSFAQGVGAALTFALVAAVGRSPSAVAALVVAAGTSIVLGATTHVPAGVAVCVVFGGAIVVAELTATIALGESSSTTEVAAAVGLLDAAVVGAAIAGSLVAPLAAAAVGAAGAFVAAGVLMLVIAGAVAHRGH